MQDEFEGNEAFFEKNRPKNLGWDDIFWVVTYIALFVTFFMQSSKISKLEAKIESDTRKIEFLKKELNMTR